MQTNMWMILPELEIKLETIYAQAVDPAALDAASAPAAAEDLVVVGGTARIPISGVLLSKPDRWLSMFGVEQTSYLDIQAQVAKAEADPEVSAIEFHVNSGGGEASNDLIETADVIFAAAKPTTAVVADMAASAAYWLASQADEITLAGPATMVGSIGVATDRFVSEHRVSIASTDAPRKRPDATTTDGKASIRRLLDDMHGLFVSAIARGRGVGADVIRTDFGQGGVVLAAEALRVGMADRVIRSGAEPAQRGTVAAMDLESLRASHPDVYQQAVDIGQKQERKRVAAHLKLGKAYGAMDSAVGFVTDGSSVIDENVQAEYLAARATGQRQADRQADNAGGVDPVTPTPEATTDAGVQAFRAELGFTN